MRENKLIHLMATSSSRIYQTAALNLATKMQVEWLYAISLSTSEKVRENTWNNCCKISIATMAKWIKGEKREHFIRYKIWTYILQKNLISSNSNLQFSNSSLYNDKKPNIEKRARYRIIICLKTIFRVHLCNLNWW